MTPRNSWLTANDLAANCCIPGTTYKQKYMDRLLFVLLVFKQTEYFRPGWQLLQYLGGESKPTGAAFHQWKTRVELEAAAVRGSQRDANTKNSVKIPHAAKSRCSQL